MFGEHAIDESRIRNVAGDCDVGRVSGDIRKVFCVPGVRKFVQVHDASRCLLSHEDADEMAADESVSTGDENCCAHIIAGSVSISACRSGGNAASRGEIVGCVPGHAMASSGSFQMIPLSCSGEYSCVILYMMSAVSLNV